MPIPFKFDLRETLKDMVTEFEGVVMARTQYATDCNHYGLLSKKLDEKGNPKDYVWIDETRLESTKAKKMIFHLRKPSSGPYPNAPTR
jgi:hypothetical protein